MAKKFPNIETLKVYQKGGDNQDIKKCPDATTDIEVNIDHRERSIVRANYSKANSEDKCGNCIFFDLSSRMKKCMDSKSDNKGYCWDQEFVCGKDNVCDMWEEGGPIKSNDSSYMKDESEYEQNKEEVEEIQTAQQMPIASQEPQQAVPQMTAPQGPSQAMAPPQQAPPQEQMQPTYAYGGSLRKAQNQEELTNPIDPTTGLPYDDDMLAVKLEAEAEAERLAGIDDNTDIYDEANPKEAGNTLKDKYKNWRTKRAIKKHEKSLTNQDENFISWNAPPEQGVIGSVANWFKSVNKEFTTDWDHDNSKENYQKLKVTNPFDEDRYFDPAKPGTLETLGQRKAGFYNDYTKNRVELYPELYQTSSMNENGDITYTGEKLLGDMYETEYMPSVVSIQYNEDGTGITGGNFFTGVDDKGIKQYEFIPFDKENPSNISYTETGQKTNEQCIRLKTECAQSKPPGVWDGSKCKCTWDSVTEQGVLNMEGANVNLDDMTIPKDGNQMGGMTLSYAFMRDGGSLPKAQSSNGAQDVAAQYMVNPQQFDYETNMPKEGAISSYGDVWQGGQWVDAVEELQGFNTPDSEQFGIVADAFSDETGITNRNANYDPDRAYPFSANAINREMKTAAANTYDVRRRDINTNTFSPSEGSLNKSHGTVWDTDAFINKDNVTPLVDKTDNFAFEGDNNTLSKRQLRDVRRNDKRQNKATAAGFSSWDEMEQFKSDEEILKDQQRKDYGDRWGDTPGVRARNKINYALDSDLGQTFQKGSKALVEGAKIGNDIFDIINEDKEQERLLTTRTADEMYGVTSADALSRGEHDENTGIFQTDDKVIARRGKYGIELPRHQSLGPTTRKRYKYDWTDSGFRNQNYKQGGEKTIEVNTDMYYELIAAGADLEII